MSDETIPSVDPTALSYWFPKVEAAGLPVPRTRILEMPADVHKAILMMLWGEPPDPADIDGFIAALRAEAENLGAPFFLRTDHTSGKHQWRETCFVADPDQLERHIFAIAEFSECASLIGLPWHRWVVRELLPTMPVGVCPHYGDMPVCKEFRFFVNGADIECIHPYWPREPLEQGGCILTDQQYAELVATEDGAALMELASRAGAAVGGRWSVDLLETERGWFLTDMAEADKSYHWPNCPTQAIETRSAETEGLSPKGESAVGEADAPKGNPA